MRTQPPAANEIFRKVSRLAFGNPVIQNNLRGLVVEVIVESALAPCWRLCSGDWSGWDFEHDSGTRLEVRQSACRQTWDTSKTRWVPRFDAAPRKGHYVGNVYTGNPTPKERYAQIYVFALHAIGDDTADQRDATQWQFYVVPSPSLSGAKSIGLTKLTEFSGEYRWDEPYGAVEQARAALGQGASGPIRAIAEN